MKDVGKYNIYKGVSTVLTLGAPIVTLFACGDFFLERSDRTISAAAVFTILVVLLLGRDKLAEKMKFPSAFVLSLGVLVFITIVESIIYPIKIICIVTAITSGLDKITFEHLYKNIEVVLPDIYKGFMHCGFICTTTDNLQAAAEKKFMYQGVANVKEN